MLLRKAVLIRALLFSFVVLSMVLSGAVAAPNAAAPQQVQTVQSLEDTLFATRYDQESVDNRVGRLEETVFGQRQTTGSLDSRIVKLKSALSPNALGPLSPLAKSTPTIKPVDNKATAKGTEKPVVTMPQSVASGVDVANNTVTNTNKVKPRPIQQIKQPIMPSNMSPTAGETDYPTVTQMEQKVLGKTFTQEDITQRLNRLEKEVFKLPQSGALADRVDNLRLVVLGDTGNALPSVASYSTGGNGGYYPQPGPAQTYVPPQSNTTYYTLPPNQGGNTTNYGYNGGYGNANGYPGTQVANNAAPAYGGGQQYYGQQPAPANYQPQNYPNANSYPAGYQPGAYAAGTGNGQVSPDLIAAMSEVEKEVLGHTYPSEPINARLDRVENKVFHTTSPDLDPQERMQRVIAVASAGGAPTTPTAKAKSTFQTLLPIILTILPLILL